MIIRYEVDATHPLERLEVSGVVAGIMFALGVKAASYSAFAEALLGSLRGDGGVGAAER